MKNSVLGLIGVFTAAVLLAAGCNSEHGDDFGPTPTPSGTAVLPTLATFTTKVEPFLDNNGCAVGGCHLGPTGAGGTPYTLAVGGSAANFAQTACSPRLQTLGASPTGTLLNHFCTASGAAIATGHQSKIATAQNCTDWYAWAGEGSGPPPTCP